MSKQKGLFGENGKTGSGHAPTARKPVSGACDSAFLQLWPHIKENMAPS